MRSIKHVLTERYYAWEDAVDLAKTDKEIDLSGQGNVYTPSEYLEPEESTAPEQVQAQVKAEAIDPSSIPATKTRQPSTTT